MTSASRQRRRPFRMTTLVLGLIAAVLVLSRLLPRSTPHARPAEAAGTAPAVASGTASGPANLIEATVERVIDGDTVALSDGRRVRVRGIDAPERDEQGYAAAKEALVRLAEGKRMRLEVDPENAHDRYGRLLAHIVTDSGRTAEEQLLESGLAWIYRLPEDSPHLAAYRAAQRRAIEQGLGIWAALPAAAPPESDGSGGTLAFMGNRSSHIVHDAGCSNARRISEANRIPLPSLREAFQEGYSPGRQCLQWPALKTPPGGKPARPRAATTGASKR